MVRGSGSRRGRQSPRGCRGRSAGGTRGNDQAAVSFGDIQRGRGPEQNDVADRIGKAEQDGFITIEDETGCANLVVFQKLFDTFRKEILQSRLLMVELL